MGMTSQRGFSMMELVMVMTIIGITAVYAGAKWQGDLTLYPKADQFMNDIRRAQAMAMSRDGDFTIASVGSDSYRIKDGAGVAVDPQPTVLSGVTIPAFTITFDGRGDPGANSVTLQLSMQGDTVSIEVVGNTGVVRKL